MTGDVDLNGNNLYLQETPGSRYGLGYLYGGLADLSIISDNGIHFVESDTGADRGAMYLNSGVFDWFGDFKVGGSTTGLPWSSPQFNRTDVYATYTTMYLSAQSDYSNHIYMAPQNVRITGAQISVNSSTNADSYTFKLYVNEVLKTTITFMDPADFTDVSGRSSKVSRKTFSGVNVAENERISILILSSTSSNADVSMFLDGTTNG
jgi:hypothetical protein